MKYLSLLLISIIFINCSQPDQDKSWSVASPSKQLSIQVGLDSGNLTYTVKRNDNGIEKVILEKSPMGVELKNKSFSDFKFFSADSVVEIDETYTLISGKQLNNRNLANQLVLHFRDNLNFYIDVYLRVYDDGVAFRYQVKSDDSNPIEVLGENTGFKLPLNGKAWIQPYDSVTMWTPAYEKYFTDGLPISSTSPQKNGWCFPALFELGNQWVLISESNLNGSYVGSHLNAEASDGLYTIRFPEATEAKGSYPQGAIVSESLVTPWRTIIIGQSIAQVVESNLINHLADSPAGDFSWVKPGRASWSWWSDHASSQDFSKLKNFVDLAANMGWEYSLVDANWNIMKGGTLEQLASYAQSKNVGLWAWYNSGGPHNDVNEQPRDIMFDANKRKQELQMLNRIGVKGIKVDFFQSDKQPIIQQYLDILKDAADNQIMVNFHGCTIPRGWQRTWPNLLSMESVKGAESYSFSKDYPENAARQNTILPFTRNVIGSMDYTPVTFTNQTYPHTNTWAHELALSIVFETGILHFADRVSAYESLPKSVKDFVMSVPNTWDATRLVSGYPGKEVIIARQSGNNWYVGGINGERESKKITMDFSFLNNGEYEATLMSDGTDKTFTTTSLTVTKQSKQSIDMLAEGGFVILVNHK